MELAEGGRGTPSVATLEKGRMFYEVCVEGAVAFIREYQNGTIEKRLSWGKKYNPRH